MSADLIGAIDRAVLELPEDLQIIWLRFRPHVYFGYRGAQVMPAEEPTIVLYHDRAVYDAIGVDLYWPNSVTHIVNGEPLHVARRITEYFRDRTTP